MTRRSYSSLKKKQQATVSTEGLEFELDGIQFVCHGEFDEGDMMDLALDLTDAADSNASDADPEALAAIGRLFRQVMGDDTYRAFRAHRRKYRTPIDVVQEIVKDLLTDLTARPTNRPSDSPAGPPTISPSSTAAVPSPQPVPVQEEPVTPEEIVGKDFALLGDYSTAPVPATAPGTAPDPGPVMNRTINLGDPSRTRVEAAAS